MTTPTSPPAGARRIAFALVAATASTTLAIGVTIASLSGWIGPPTERPVAAPDPAPLLVPITPIAPPAAAPAEPAEAPLLDDGDEVRVAYDDDDHDEDRRDHRDDDHDDDDDEDDDD